MVLCPLFVSQSQEEDRMQFSLNGLLLLHYPCPIARVCPWQPIPQTRELKELEEWINVIPLNYKIPYSFLGDAYYHCYPFIYTRRSAWPGICCIRWMSSPWKTRESRCIVIVVDLNYNFVRKDEGIFLYVHTNQRRALRFIQGYHAAVACPAFSLHHGWSSWKYHPILQ